jgi:diaminopimelate epimerase
VTLGVPVVKMNGTGNDFILVDERVEGIGDPAAFARRVCDRTRGIGADGVLLVGRSDRFDARMTIVNADGSEAEMCGNGMRCVARYLDESGEHRESAVIDTIAGPISTRVLGRDPYRIAVEMAEPKVGPRYTIGGFEAVDVDLGNPHTVILVDDFSGVDIAVDGPRIERDARYPRGTNVHFARRDGTGWHVLHWERGAGATSACGTGAVAVAAVLASRGLAESPMRLYVPGGILEVELAAGENATLIGDAVREFERIIP